MANDIYNQLAIFLFIVFIFAIIFVKYPKKPVPVIKQPIQHIAHPPVTNIPKELPKVACYDARMQSLNSRKKDAVGDKYDSEELASFYLPAKDTVPEDFPVKQIGDCPYSKMQAHDIPIGNVPQCMAEKQDYNMRLQLYQLNKA